MNGKQTMPEGGWPLRLAITALALPERANFVAFYEACLNRPGSEDGTRRARDHILWLDLIVRHHRGDVKIRGRASGSLDFIDVEPAFLNGATADYDADAIDCGDFKFLNVRVLPAVKSAAPAPNPWTSTDVKVWFVERKAAVSEDAPWFTEAEDISAAEKLFIGVQRELIRSLRAELIESHRMKKGPRSKSAKPPT